MFKYVPINIQIILLVVCGVVIIYEIIFKWRSLRKSVFLLYVTSVVLIINSLTLILIESSLSEYMNFRPFIFSSEIVLAILLSAQIFYLSFTAKDQERAKKLRKIAYVIAIIGLLPVLIVFIIFDVIK